MRLHFPFLLPFVCLAGGELRGLVAPNRIREGGKCSSILRTAHPKRIFINFFYSFYISISSAFSVVGRRPVRRSSSLSAYLTSRGGDGQRRVGNSSSRRRHLQQQQQQPRPLVDARVRSASTSGLDRWQKVNWHTIFDNRPSYDKTIDQFIHAALPWIVHRRGGGDTLPDSWSEAGSWAQVCRRRNREDRQGMKFLVEKRNNMSTEMTEEEKS